MSEVLILEFPGVTADQYEAVQKRLDLKASGDGWPAALTNHVAAMSATHLVVVEVWESRETEGEFMQRLGPVLAEVGVPDPSRFEWLTLVGEHVGRPR